MTETDTTLTGTGTLTVRDLDFSNTVTASVVSPAVLTGTTGGLTSANVIGMLTVTVGAIAADPTDIHNLTWNFNSGAQAFNFLAAGQSLSIAYTVRGTDNSATPATGDQTVTITINGTNDAPKATASSVTTIQNASYTFVVSDFHFTDAEGNAAASITIGTRSLAAGDTLRLSGVDVTNGQTITVAQIPNLVYTPASGTAGAGAHRSLSR